jgi:hypothetical protein
VKKNILYIVVILFLSVTGCSITQEYHFKNDFSGNSKTSIDLTMLKGFMSNLDSTGKGNSLDTMDRSLAEVAKELEGTGVENVKYGWNDDKTVLFISYDFKNPETLNKAVGAEQTSSKMLGGNSDPNQKAHFDGKGKKFFYDSPEITQEDTLFNSESMASMKDYYKYSLIFSFDRKIKSFDNKKATLSDDGKSVVFAGNIADMFAKGSSFDIHVKLGKK